MDGELEALEEKVRLAAQLCHRLRDENRDLRQRLATLQSDRKQMSDKMDTARTRLETLLRQIPE